MHINQTHQLPAMLEFINRSVKIIPQRTKEKVNFTSKWKTHISLSASLGVPLLFNAAQQVQSSRMNMNEEWSSLRRAPERERDEYARQSPRNRCAHHLSLLFQSRGGFSCHFKTNDWSPSWGLGQHRACWKRGGSLSKTPVPKCPSSSFLVSFHHGVKPEAQWCPRKREPPTPSHTHKRTHTQYRERNFDLLARFPPLCDLLPIFPKTAESGSLRGSRPHSPLSLLLPGYE